MPTVEQETSILLLPSHSAESPPAGATARSAARHSAFWTALTALLAGAALWGIYARVLDAPLLFDDWVSVDNSPSITHLWPLVGDAEHPGPLNPTKYTPTAGRPVVNFTFALNYALGDARPWGYRTVNVLIHWLSAILLAAIVRRTLQLDYFAGRYTAVAGPLSVAVALVWAVHPLHTESIAYITQRTELLVGLFYLATLYAAIRYWSASNDLAAGPAGDPAANNLAAAPATPARCAWLTVAILACLAGMGSKEVMVTAPVVVLLYDRTFLTGNLRRALRRSWPLYLGLAGGWILLAALNLDGPRSKDSGFGLGVSAVSHWLTQTKVLAMYGKLALWPWPLVIHYDMPHLQSVGEAWPWLLPVSLFVLATGVLLWKRSAVGFLGAWVLLVSSPTLVVPVITEIAAERRMYLPLAAVVTLLVVGGYRVLCYLTQRILGGELGLRAARRALVTCLLLVVGWVTALSAVGATRLWAYRDAVTIWTDAVRYQPEDATVQGNLGLALIDAARAAEAIAPLERSLELRPDAEAHSNLARGLLSVGRPEEAIELYRWIIERQPQNADARYNLGIALVQAGRPQEALEHCEMAVRLRPASVEAQYDMGVALVAAGRPADAVAYYREALRLKPNYVPAHINLGNALLELGKPAAAVEQYGQALQIKPDNADAYANLGTAQLRLNDPAAAITNLREAVRLQPNLAEGHYNLAMALTLVGDLPSASEEFEAALKIRPDYAEAWANLATARARQQRPSDALAAAERALELARAQHNPTLEQQLLGWLRAYRASLQPAN